MANKNHVLPVLAGDGLSKEEPLWKSSAMTKRGAFAALSYMACAVLLVMFNKAVLSSYNFPCPNVITLLQIICSTTLLYALRSWNIISFGTAEGRNTSADAYSRGFISLETLMRTSPLSCAYLLYMIAGMASIRGVNVPMYTTLRRTTVGFTMVVEYFHSGQKYPPTIIGSVGLILFGAFIAGARDLSFDFNGYMIVIISNITTAIYLATIARIGKTSGLNSFGLMWCNGLICGPILLLWIIFSGELEMTMHFPHLYSPAFQDLVTVVIGWLLFGGLPFDWLNVVGQSLGFFGSGVYAYYKIKGN